jgi:hypothetical protein
MLRARESRIEISPRKKAITRIIMAFVNPFALSRTSVGVVLIVLVVVLYTIYIACNSIAIEDLKCIYLMMAS